MEFDKKLNDIEQLVNDYKVPQIYQTKLVMEILKNGQEDCQSVLDKHKQGGTRFNK